MTVVFLFAPMIWPTLQAQTQRSFQQISHTSINFQRNQNATIMTLFPAASDTPAEAGEPNQILPGLSSQVSTNYPLYPLTLSIACWPFCHQSAFENAFRLTVIEDHQLALAHVLCPCVVVITRVMWVPVTGNVVTHRFWGREAAQRLRPRLCRIAKAARECSAVGKGSSGCGEVGNRNIGLHGALLVWVVAGDRKRSRTLARDTKICRGGRRGRQHVKLESLRPRKDHRQLPTASEPILPSSHGSAFASLLDSLPLPVPELNCPPLTRRLQIPSTPSRSAASQNQRAEIGVFLDGAQDPTRRLSEVTFGCNTGAVFTMRR
ncbi:hypothetical protein EDB92DRAFT_1819026 [Lactarius akahatsu]|uniref:Uncharacterized protein n=1 Tax=Lactarius akahatsu TaxID=416441 RepID=A0AAD4L8N3_9AGAM|nr:hypothetical protein EDB92DRAFT_1819026 [Lactarius akahatsu]